VVIFSSSNNKRISIKEFKRRVRPRLFSEGFSRDKLDGIENLFQGDLRESGKDSGISAKELEERLKYMRKYPSKHNLSSKQVDKLEEELRKLL
jgi:hypothetical protein